MNRAALICSMIVLQQFSHDRTGPGCDLGCLAVALEAGNHIVRQLIRGVQTRH